MTPRRALGLPSRISNTNAKSAKITKDNQKSQPFFLLLIKQGRSAFGDFRAYLTFVLKMYKSKRTFRFTDIQIHIKEAGWKVGRNASNRGQSPESADIDNHMSCFYQHMAPLFPTRAEK